MIRRYFNGGYEPRFPQTNETQMKQSASSIKNR